MSAITDLPLLRVGPGPVDRIACQRPRPLQSAFPWRHPLRAESDRCSDQCAIGRAANDCFRGLLLSTRQRAVAASKLAQRSSLEATEANSGRQNFLRAKSKFASPENYFSGKGTWKSYCATQSSCLVDEPFGYRKVTGPAFRPSAARALPRSNNLNRSRSWRVGAKRKDPYAWSAGKRSCQVDA
jgi:hypothetical protein